MTMLHWHWFVPVVELGDHHQRPDDEHHRPGSGPALHAHVGDWSRPADWRGEPVIQPRELAGGSSITWLSACPTAAGSPFAAACISISIPGVLRGHASNPAGGIARRAAALFQRWNC